MKPFLISNSTPDFRSIHLVSLGEGQMKAGQESKVTPQDAVLEHGLKTCLCPVQSCHIVNLPCSNDVSMVGGGNQGLALFNHVPLLQVTAPRVDNNGVILLYVAASLNLTDHFSSALMCHSTLSWDSSECFPI